MSKMILLFSHKLTSKQELDAKENWGVYEFISMPKELQTIWSSIPAELENLEEYLNPIKEFLNKNLDKDDIVLIQGDFGATCMIASFVKSIDCVGVYATTKRDVVERELDGKIIKTSVFEHVRFRKF